MTQKPRAFVIPPADRPPPAPDPGIVITRDPEEIVDAADGTPVPVGEGRGAPWLAMLLTAISSLVVLALGLWAEALLRTLFLTSPWLGWVGAALVLLAVVSGLAIVLRELWGLRREHRIEDLRERAIQAVQGRDSARAAAVAAELAGLYRNRPETARGRGRLAATEGEILEAEDRLIIAERELLRAYDDQAKRIVAEAAKQVSVVTALSPRAGIDVAFVIFAAVRLLRRISGVYGGRPGMLGFIRLARSAFGHLAVTGGVAVGDSLLQQVLGLGLAARISAKLGEGVLNGLMTARFGLAAIAVCRPLPFIGEEAPKVGDVAGELISRRVVEEARAERP